MMNDTDNVPHAIPLNQAVDKLRDQSEQTAMEKLKNRKSSTTAVNLKASLLTTLPLQTDKQFVGTVTEFKEHTYMNLSIDDIDLFDGNPRKHQDPQEYQNTKESIRNHGIQQPVHITKRPGEKKYILSSGGNTRLKIMKELFAETKEAKFAFIPCIFHSYTSEGDMYFAHMIENEQRADMCFWDKSTGYSKLKNIIEQEQQRNLATRELSAALLERGLPISHTNLSLMFFALNSLNGLDHLTQFLSKGKAIELRKLYNKLDELAQHPDFQSIWQETLDAWSKSHPYDEDVDLENLSQFIETTIVDHFGIQLSDEALDTDHLDEIGSEPLVFDMDSGSSDENPTIEANDNVGTSTVSISKTPLLSPTLKPIIASPAADAPDTQNTPVVDEPFFRATLAEARDSIHKYATALLNYVYLNECFVVHESFKYGFYVELPDFERLANEDHIKTKFELSQHPTLIDCLHTQARDIYWFLADLSGQMDDWVNENAIVYQLPEASLFKKFVTDEGYEYEVKSSLLGDYSSGSKHIINWTCLPAYLQLNQLFQHLVNSVRTFNLIS